jgi:hypothetical protein
MESGIVTRACNPSYLGGRYQEDRCSRPAEQKVGDTSPMSTKQAEQVELSYIATYVM